MALSWCLYWPLYTVLPVASLSYYLGYLYVWEFIGNRYIKSYPKLDPINKMCFRANCGSAVHSYTVVILLVYVLATDDALHTTRVRQHYNPVGYSAMCITLAYFSLSIPWNLKLRYCMKERQVAPLSMLLHHVMVVIAALIYVLGLVCALYGAVGFVCMELSNWFLIARALAEQLGWNNGSKLGVANGLMLVVTFIVVRVGLGTMYAVRFSMDMAKFSSDDVVEWVLVSLAYAIFIAVLLLSYAWLGQVLSGCRTGLRQLLSQHALAEVTDGRVHPSTNDDIEHGDTKKGDTKNGKEEKKEKGDKEKGKEEEGEKEGKEDTEESNKSVTQC